MSRANAADRANLQQWPALLQRLERDEARMEVQAIDMI